MGAPGLVAITGVNDFRRQCPLMDKVCIQGELCVVELSLHLLAWIGKRAVFLHFGTRGSCYEMIHFPPSPQDGKL